MQKQKNNTQPMPENNKYETLEKAGYEFIRKEGRQYVMLNKETNEKELFFHNQFHASWGLIYNGHHLEFASTLPDETPTQPTAQEQKPEPVQFAEWMARNGYKVDRVG